MNKVSDVLTERFSQDPLESYFCKKHPPGTSKVKLPLCDFSYANTFWIQNVFKPISTVKVRDENINFESDRTSSMSEKIQTIQSMLSSKFSSSHQITSYQTHTINKLNEFINKLTLPYFNYFCQPFHVPFFYNIFGQRLISFYEKIFQPLHTKVFKIKKMTGS